MSTVLEQIDWDAMILSIQETLFMTFFSLLIAVVLGFGLGIILYVTKDDGLYPNKIINRILRLYCQLTKSSSIYYLDHYLIASHNIFGWNNAGSQSGFTRSYHIKRSFLCTNVYDCTK
ncbi:MAG: hypothetical protein ACLSBH_10040 [Coprobacillus cateniformis]